MTTPPSKIVHIAPIHEAHTLTKGQKQFNAFVKKIENLKKQLIEWRDLIPRFQNRMTTEYNDSLNTFNNRRVDIISLLDQAYDDKTFSRHDREKMQHVICSVATEMITVHGREDLKALYDRRSEIDFDTQQQESSGIMRAMAEEMLGIDIAEDVDLSSPEKMHAFMEEMMHKEQKEAHEQIHQTDARQAKRNNTSKQAKKEAQQKTDALSIRKSIQEVYRKLVAALHPDRERDNTERERKTELMQRVNVAYQKNDLLQLFKLQLEVEQIDHTQFSSFPEERLKHYNKILKEQADNLEQEIQHSQFPVKIQFNLPPFERLTPKDAMARLDYELREIQHSIVEAEQQIRAFKEVKRIKAWLKNYRIPVEPDMY